MTTHRIAADAMSAWDARERRRKASAGVERCVDSVMASGGILVVNAVASLNLGLPEGRAGLSLGGALLAAGLAHLSFRRRSVRVRTYAPAFAPTRVGAPVHAGATSASHRAA